MGCSPRTRRSERSCSLHSSTEIAGPETQAAAKKELPPAGIAEGDGGVSDGEIRRGARRAGDASNGKVLDSYSHRSSIVSRKNSQLALVRPKTAVGYVREAARKYSPGEVIADVPSNRARLPHLIGKRLDGRLVLEVPVQKAPVPQAVLDVAKRHNVWIMDDAGKVYG